jgi:hypothetical protein
MYVLARRGNRKFMNTINAHLILHVFTPQRRSHNPLRGEVEGIDQNLYKQGWSNLHNLVGCPNMSTKFYTIKIELRTSSSV